MKEIFTLGLTLTLGLILLYMGYFLFKHQNRVFFGVFDPTKDPSLKKAVTIWAYILTILGVLTIISALIDILLFQVVMLVLDAILVLVLSFVMPTYLKMP